MGKHLVIVGGGHAHLKVLKNLNTFKTMGNDVTVVSANAFHYYSGMGPGLLSGIYRPQEVRFNIRKMVEDRGGIFIENKAVKIDPEKKQIYLQTGDRLEYDVASFNTGSFVPLGSLAKSDDSVVPMKPIKNLLNARQMITEGLKKKKLYITVAGGGPAGVEISGNIRRLIEDKKGKAEIHLVAGSRLLHDYDEKVRSLALKSLKMRNIHVMEGVKATSVNQGIAELNDGSILESDFVFWATGVKPSPIFEASGLPIGKDGGLLVNEHLQCVSFPEIFGGGDCISFKPRPLAKVGVYAVRQNPILLFNLSAALKGDAYRKFIPQKSFMLIFNMGDGTGIVFKNSWVWKGRLAFTLKNYIDNSFMKKFQVSGERDE